MQKRRVNGRDNAASWFSAAVGWVARFRTSTTTGGRDDPDGDGDRNRRDHRDADKDYNIIWSTETCSSNALRLETHAHDVERARRRRAAGFFRRAQAESGKGASKVSGRSWTASPINPRGSAPGESTTGARSFVNGAKVERLGAIVDVADRPSGWLSRVTGLDRQKSLGCRFRRYICDHCRRASDWRVSRGDPRRNHRKSGRKAGT